MTLFSKYPKIYKAWFAFYCMSAAFITYCSMYAFRKPFTAAIFEDYQVLGIDYKILLITTQVLGYMLSKFMGINVVSSMQPDKRIKMILILIFLSWVSLFLFAVFPYPFNFIFMFFNGLPLGMIWGIVFSFLEGRKNTELLGAGMSASFIVASGLVKAAGRFFIVEWNISEFWMPFITGLAFVPLLFLGVWMLSKIPSPNKEDQLLRAPREPMTNGDRKDFFQWFAPGIILIVLIYISLTIIRDLRDNFAVEIWKALGFADNTQILATADIPIAVFVLVFTSFMILIKNNRVAFYLTLGTIALGGILLILSTSLFRSGLLNPVVWMILIGFGLYLSYVSYHTMLFERWIALFRKQSNIGYLMYIADAFGYLGSVGILFLKNYFSPQLRWLPFIENVAIIAGLLTLILSGTTVLYFLHKEKRSAPQKTNVSLITNY